MSDGDLTIAAGPLRLTVRPAWGGRVAAFSHTRFGAILVPITEQTFVPETWPTAGAYPLIPFHNRISNGAFMFGGSRIKIPQHPDASPHALHGFSSRREWRVADCGTDCAELILPHEGDAFWPWPVTCRQVFRLTPDALEVKLSVSNDSDRPMPAGIGWHPYFLKAARVADDATWIWPLRPDYRPVGERRPRFADEGPTRYLSGWDRVEVTLASGAALRLSAGPELSHLVIHDREIAYTCIEPVSHLADALGNPPKGAGNRMRILQTGDTFSGQLTVTLMG